MRRIWSWLAAFAARIFVSRTKVFGVSGKQVGEVISQRGSCVIIRDYGSFMFTVLDTEAEGGPKIVNEYAIYRNAVIGAELWEYNKRNAREGNKSHDGSTLSRNG